MVLYVSRMSTHIKTVYQSTVPVPSQKARTVQAYQCEKFETKPVIVTLQPPKANNSDRKWNTYNSRKRSAGKDYKLPGLSKLEQNLKFFWNLN